LRGVLLSAQVGISVILLANTGVLVRSIESTQKLDPGFDVQNVNVLSVELPASQYTGPRTMALTRDLLAALERSPGLPACGLALNPPLSNATYSTSFQMTPGKDAPRIRIFSNDVSGGYFEALGMRILSGRNFVPEDTGRDVVMVNEAAARRWWPGERPVGKTIISNDRSREIVGVISDSYNNDLSSIEAMIYFPITGRFGAPSVVVRDRGDASRDRITAILKQIEPRARVRAQPLADSFRQKLQRSIYAAEFSGLLGVLALLIAGVGMAGVFAYVVGQRTREIGIRMALGARPAGIVKLILGSSLQALACGLAGGIAAAAGVSMLLVHALPGIRPLDFLAYASVVLMLAVAVVFASAIPARRATRIDPVRALRWE
jgi:predicted permease